jgi:drug/metabolite transporter (DMT)-like permease
MISLFLTILCSTSIALLLKANNHRRGNLIILLMANYWVATLVSAIFWIQNQSAAFSWWTLGFGFCLGGLFVLSLFAFTQSVQIAGAALATVSARLSVALPVLLSIIFFKEMPSRFQLGGFLLTGAAIGCFYFSLNRYAKASLKIREYLYLLGLLLGIGINDFCLKLFQQWRPPTEQPLFLLAIFGSAFVYTLGYVLIMRVPLEKPTLVLGGVLGIPNIFSSFFLLGALATLPAILVYPVSNIGIIGLTALGAAVIWREQLNGWGRRDCAVEFLKRFCQPTPVSKKTGCCAQRDPVGLKRAI